MKVSPFANQVELVDDLPEAFARLVVEHFAARPGPRYGLVLSGGPTARSCYQALAAAPAGAVDWQLVDLYIGDERYVPRDDRDSNQRLVRESLVEPVGGVGSFEPLPTELPLEDAADRYAEVLGRAIGRGGLDLVHLGMGPDGHTASLFPGSGALSAPAEGPVFVPNLDPSGRNPHPRLTLTLEGISKGRLVVFTVEGDEKREPLHHVLTGADLPAAQVRAPEVRWLVGRELAEAVPPEALRR